MEPARNNEPKDEPTPTPEAVVGSDLDTSFTDPQNEPDIDTEQEREQVDKELKIGTSIERDTEVQEQNTENEEHDMSTWRKITRGSALAGVNMGLTASLSLMNFSQGNPVAATLWGGCCVLWGALIYLKAKANQ